MNLENCSNCKFVEVWGLSKQSLRCKNQSSPLFHRMTYENLKCNKYEAKIENIEPEKTK